MFVSLCFGVFLFDSVFYWDPSVLFDLVPVFLILSFGTLSMISLIIGSSLNLPLCPLGTDDSYIVLGFLLLFSAFSDFIHSSDGFSLLPPSHPGALLSFSHLLFCCSDGQLRFFCFVLSFNITTFLFIYVCFF